MSLWLQIHFGIKMKQKLSKQLQRGETCGKSIFWPANLVCSTHSLVDKYNTQRKSERERLHKNCFRFKKKLFLCYTKVLSWTLIKMYIITSSFIFVTGFLIIVEGKPATKENGDRKDPKTKEGTEKAPGLKEHQKLSWGPWCLNWGSCMSLGSSCPYTHPRHWAVMSFCKQFRIRLESIEYYCNSSSLAVYLG